MLLRELTKLSNCRGFASPATVPAKYTHCARRHPSWGPAKCASVGFSEATSFLGVGGLGLFLFGSCFGGGLDGSSAGSSINGCLPCAMGVGCCRLYIGTPEVEDPLFLLFDPSSMAVSF